MTRLLTTLMVGVIGLASAGAAAEPSARNTTEPIVFDDHLSITAHTEVGALRIDVEWGDGRERFLLVLVEVAERAPLEPGSEGVAVFSPVLCTGFYVPPPGVVFGRVVSSPGGATLITPMPETTGRAGVRVQAIVRDRITMRSDTEREQASLVMSPVAAHWRQWRLLSDHAADAGAARFDGGLVLTNWREEAERAALRASVWFDPDAAEDEERADG